MKKLKWGILSTAKIGVKKVIPPMQGSDMLTVHGIASRKMENAQSHADALGIPQAYGSYEALLADPEIDVVYNPLPNHMHLEWTRKAAEAGKHVLCEKPIALTIAEAKELLRIREQTGVLIGEAFMVKSHPQWKKARQLVQEGHLGTVKVVQGTFNYFNDDPNNIRNIAEYGGGGMWDIGCYPVTTARFVMEEEPKRVVASLIYDPQFGTDILSSVLMEFPSGANVQFSVSTQLSPYQRMVFQGTEKSLEVMVPFNAPDDRPTLLTINSADILFEQLEQIELPVCNQYKLQAEDFTRAVLEGKPAPSSLEDALGNTRALIAIFQSAKEGRWVEV